MEQAESQKEKKDKYNLDDDTSSYSPEIEEESNNGEELEESNNKESQNINYEEQAEENKNTNINESKSSVLYDKLMSIQKKMDSSQEKQKYLQFNQSNENNSNYKKSYFPKKKIYKKDVINEYDDSKYQDNNNNDNEDFNSKVNKNVMNLNESDNENEHQYELDNNNNNIEDNNNYNNRNMNRHKRFQQRESSNIKQKETNLKEKGCELFIGNLNISTEKDDLMKLFMPYGNIIDIRIHKNEDNKKCYAFVRYSTKEMANNALKLDSTLLNNRHIKVTKSNENATIFIGNIRKTWTQEELEKKIRRIFHNINKIEFFTDPINPNKNRGFCFGIFNTRSEAIKALNYVNKKGGINIDGISITCDWADVVDDDDNSKSNQIFLSNIKKDVQEEDLKNYFNKFAEVISVIMSKNHVNSKRKDLVFITFETHEDAVSAIKQFDEEKKNVNKIKELKKIFLLGENENINMIQVSLAFSQEAMQNKKKIKDNRKKIPQNSGNSNNNNNNGGNNTSGGNNHNNRGNNSSNKNNNKSFMGNISMNANNDYKGNYNSGHRSKSYQKHDHGNNQNNLAGNKNVNDLLSSLSNNKSYGNNNYPMNYNNNNNKNNQMNTNLVNQLNQLFTSSLDPNNMNKANNTTNINNFMNNNNNAANISNQNLNNNINQNQLLVLSNILNLCQQNPSLLQQMNSLNNIYSPGVNSKNEIIDINSEKKFINRKRNSSNNNYTNNINNNLNPNNNFNNSSMSNDLQNNNFLNISPNQTRNQNIISQFPYIQNNSTVSSINNPNVPNISNIQNLQNIIPTIPNNPNFNNFSK
jgi:RNA recognition motif-containing protein